MLEVWQKIQEVVRFYLVLESLDFIVFVCLATIDHYNLFSAK